MDDLFRDAEEELAGLSDKSLKAKPLRSLLNHREGLRVFVDLPEVPMDNNAAERILREPVIGRRLSLGSDSEKGARFTAVMYSVVVTLKMNGIDILKWLESWLGACAGNGAGPPTTCRRSCHGRWPRSAGGNWRRRDDPGGGVPLPRPRLHRR